MTIGHVCGGNKKLCDLWNADYEKEEKRTQKRKEKETDQDKTTLDDDAGKNDLTRRDDTSCQ